MLRGRSEPLRAYEPLPAGEVRGAGDGAICRGLCQAGGRGRRGDAGLRGAGRAACRRCAAGLSPESGCSTAPRAFGCSWNDVIRAMPDMTRDFAAGNYRFIPAVFQYSSGAAADPGFEIERVRFDRLTAAGRRFCADREIYSGGGTAADLVLRLRVAFAGGVYRGGISGFQPALRQDACGMGHLRRHHQSGGAQQCLPGDRSAGRAVILRVLLYAAEPGESADADRLRHRRRRRGARRSRQLSGADRALPRSQPGWLEGEGCDSPSGEMESRLARSDSAGRTRRRCRPIPCTTFIPSSPTNWSAAAPRVPA